MPATREELTGTFESPRWISPEGKYLIGYLESGDAVKGPISDPTDLTPGISYRFHGYWKEDPQYGNQFHFQAFVQTAPRTRHGVIEYLQRNCKGIGSVISHQLCDLYGDEFAVATLKNDPEKVANAIPRLGKDAAVEASKALKRREAWEATTIELLDLFSGRGFPASDLIQKCIKRWGVHAGNVVKRDPFKLLTSRMPGCGFLRVDRLYLELGHPPDRLKRQMMAIVHAMRSEMGGSTWHSREHLRDELKKRITGRVRPEKAIRMGLIAGWLVEERELDGGGSWITERKLGDAERDVAADVLKLLGGDKIKPQKPQKSSPELTVTLDIEPADWGSALEQCNRILELCEELPDAAFDFAASVSEGVAEVAEWIEEHKHVTESQQEALDNWESGCERWLERV